MRIAVLVQQQIVSDVSIVAFSANPVTGSRDEIVITASWGLGESLVGGTVTPDTWCGAARGRIEAERIGDKRRMTWRSMAARTKSTCRASCVGWRRSSRNRLPRWRGWRRRWKRIPDTRSISSVPIAGGRLYLLQCRPITTLGPPHDCAGPLTPREIVEPVPAGGAGGDV